MDKKTRESTPGAIITTCDGKCGQCPKFDVCEDVCITCKVPWGEGECGACLREKMDEEDMMENIDKRLRSDKRRAPYRKAHGKGGKIE